MKLTPHPDERADAFVARSSCPMPRGRDGLLAFLLFSVSWLPVLAAAAQTASAPPVTVLQLGTRIVAVDVTVRDRNGRPVHGLKREDFLLTEDKRAQKVSHFEEHSPADVDAARAPGMPKLPPGTFTDYTPVPPAGTLNVLLLDALNTPLSDQAYVRSQLAEYVQKASPGTSIAIFGLNSGLTMLQGFTAQPEVLKNAVAHKLLAQGSTLLDDPGGTGSQPQDLSSALSDAAPAGASGNGEFAQTVANLQQFEGQTASIQLHLRLQYTLDAFNQLARYLATFPGRKNLIWFSGSFPLNILPDSSVGDPFASTATSEAEFRDTIDLLTGAQVAVYPVDARGVMVNPVFDASQSGRGFANNPGAFGKKISDFSASQAGEHSTMDKLAENTGGRAFYGTNGLAEAVTSAIDDGSSYYTLTYSPSDATANGVYRSIHVALNGTLDASGITLAYRRGYFATQASGGVATGGAGQSSGADDPSARYTRSVMTRGAPAPSEILFTVRVVPASQGTVEVAASGNHPAPGEAMQGSLRNYAVDFAAFASSFHLAAQPDGTHAGTIQFTALIYSPQGKLLNSEERAIKLTLPARDYADSRHHAVEMHMEVSAPAKGESYLRMAIHDLGGNRFGVVEIPVSSVSGLKPVAPAGPSH